MVNWMHSDKLAESGLDESAVVGSADSFLLFFESFLEKSLNRQQ